MGSGALVRSLLRDGLVDELGIMVHPVIMGCGKRLFWEGGALMGLELIESKTFGTGVVSLTYRPTVGQDAERGYPRGQNGLTNDLARAPQAADQ